MRLLSQTTLTGGIVNDLLYAEIMTETILDRFGYRNENRKDLLFLSSNINDANRLNKATE